MSNTEKAILVISFGTSHPQTREKTIDRIEQKIADTFPDYQIYRAWTSKMIIRKLFQRDGVRVCTVKEAMELMVKDGIREVIVQPTHVINGRENDSMKDDILSYAGCFDRLVFGNPLLTTEQDNWDMIGAIRQEYSFLKDTEALVLMGHGTTHYANSVYAALDYAFKDKEFSNIYLGTVEAYPSIDTLKKMLARQKPEKIYLAPFMIVAGDHAVNDMSGDDPDSWKCQLEQEGYQVECILKGLGEYPAIQEIFIRHISDNITEMA